MSVVNMPIEYLVPHPQNPRKDLGNLEELTASIKENGIYQNLTVIPVNISGNALAQARKELDEQLNAVLEAWLKKHKVDAGWYDRAGIEGTYRFCGDKFIRVSKAGDDA